MSSGVVVNDEVVSLFEELKIRHSFKYMICQIDLAAGEIKVVEKAAAGADSKAQYEEFIKKLPAKEGRYAVYDFDYELKDGGQRNKLMFVVWAPDDAPIKEKMVYASSKDAIKKKLNGIAYEVQGTDFDEVEWDTVYNGISGGGTK